MGYLTFFTDMTDHCLKYYSQCKIYFETVHLGETSSHTMKCICNWNIIALIDDDDDDDDRY